VSVKIGVSGTVYAVNIQRQQTFVLCLTGHDIVTTDH